MFKNIIAQDRALNVLKNAIKTGRIAQAYIFYGSEGSGKLLTALSLAKALNCLHVDIEQRPCEDCSSCKKIDQFTHPDIKFIFPIPNYDMDSQGIIKSKTEFESYQKYIQMKISTPWKDFVFEKVCAIRIEQIRALQRDISMSKYEGRKKVYIFEGFDSLTLQASNAFLKTLEEPPSDTHFILIVNNIEKLLPTILSRCAKIKFYPIHAEIIESFLLKKMKAEPMKAKLFARLANGSIEKAINLFLEENLETMDITIYFLEIVIKRDDIAFLEWIEKHFVKGSKNTELFKSFIQYLCLWIKDLQTFLIYHHEEDVEANSIVFINQKNLLTQFSANEKSFSDLLPNLLLELNEYQVKNAGNVNQKLILSQVYHSFIRTFFYDK